MRIDVWSDVSCPWCWIGKHRLARALELLGQDAPPLEVHWHAYQLDPDAGPEPVPLREALAAKFGGPARVEQMLERVQAAGREDGLAFDWGQGQVRANTFDAHRVVWLAGQVLGADPAAVAEALFQAHFRHGRNVADAQVLVEAGAAGGLAPDRVRAMLAGEEGRAQVRAQLDQARVLGIQAVPTFVIDGTWGVQGAQPPQALAQALARMAGERAAAAPAGDACGPDGCTV